MYYLIVFLVWLIFLGISIFIEKGILSLEILSQLGDSFNIITSLFAGLAFASVLVSINTQKKELRETLKEFELQRKVMQLQQFDNKFFQLLELLNNIIKKNNINPSFLKENILRYFMEADLKFFDINVKTYNQKKYLKYYFSNLYQILNYIDTYYLEQNNPDKKQYIDIVRAQLSLDELVLLFYHCIASENESDINYKKLLEKYKFFEYLPYESFLLINEITEVSINYMNEDITNYILMKYDKKVFGENKDILQRIEAK